jgi:hypothetical protein
MGNELQLPPRRPLPPEVRDRIRARALADLDRPRRFRHGRAPLAVAAGVAVLAAGAVIVGQSVSGGAGEPGDRKVPPTGTSSANRPLDLRKANSELDRCWAAIQAEGNADKYPDRSRWRAVSTGGYVWVTVTAAFADGKPIFCQTSITTVRVSQPADPPAYAEGSTTAALFISPEGTIAGIRDPSWPGVGVFVGNGSGLGGSTPELLAYGLFVDVVRERIQDSTQILVDRWQRDQDRAEHPEKVALPRPAPPVSQVDRPQPGKDRVSDRGRWLKQCLDNSASPVVDADMWEPGAIVDIDGNRYMVLRSGQDFAYCFYNGSHWGFGESVIGVTDFAKNGPHMLPGPNFMLETTKDSSYVTGALPDAVTKVEIVQGSHPVIQADVLNKTFAAQLFEAPDRSDVVRGYDDAGSKLYEGTFY